MRRGHSDASVDRSNNPSVVSGSLGSLRPPSSSSSSSRVHFARARPEVMDQALPAQSLSRSSSRSQVPEDAVKSTGCIGRYGARSRSRDRGQGNRGDDRQSQNSLDFREDGTPKSRRHRMWNSFKRTAGRIRSKSRENRSDDQMTDSHPDVSSVGGSNPGSPLVGSTRDFDELFARTGSRLEAASDRLRSLDADLRDGGATSGMESAGELLGAASLVGEDSEFDSGIAVRDNPKLGPARVSRLLEEEARELEYSTKRARDQAEKKRPLFARNSSVESTDAAAGAAGAAGGKQPSAAKRESSIIRNRHAEYRSHHFFQMDVVLYEGHDLVIRDTNGTSDPYVKFKIDKRIFYKSRTVFKNLNPRWDEKFSVPIEDPFKPVQVLVFDYDRGLSDDSMGSGVIEPTSFELSKPREVKLMLSDPKGKEPYMGYILMKITMNARSKEEKEQYLKRTMKLGDNTKKSKNQQWSAIATIILVEGKELLAMDDNGFSDPYVKFRLGNERYKSKFKPKTLNPRWLEQFDLWLFDDQTKVLEVSVWDHDAAGKDDVMGRVELDLGELEIEKTHDLNCVLEDGAGIIRVLLSISGTVGTESDVLVQSATAAARLNHVRRFGLARSVKDIKDVGWCQIKVLKAQGLASADLGGKSDPFAVVELVNSRVQTHTIYKTLYPEWGKVYSFAVKDIHAILEVTVFDEDRDKKYEFLGKVLVPLLRIRCGERRWYQLKDKKGMCRAKGAIQLEMDLIYNHLRAAIRTVNPMEEKYMKPEVKFKVPIMKKNIDRVQKIAEAGVEGGKFLQSCFNWDSKLRSISAFIAFLIMVWTFELFLVPIALLIMFFYNFFIIHLIGNLMKGASEDEYEDEMDDDDDDDKGSEEKKSFKERIQQIQEICLQVQEGMDMAASMGERVKNTFNWTVPWLSWFAVILLSIGAVALYFVPLRIIIMLWGVNKFTKKLRAPNAIANNELLDFLSRVPSDKELMMYRDLRPDSNIGSVKSKKS